ncbi:hypothetical protein Tco_0709801 [Tanacetum coccineum]
MSKKQDCTAMSTAEAEYVALFASCAQVMWMRTQLKDYGFDYNNVVLRISFSHSNLITGYQLANMFTKFRTLDPPIPMRCDHSDFHAIASAEAEYVTLSASCAQAMLMETQLKDSGFDYNKILLYCDSKSAITISCNSVQPSRTKHIHTRYHFTKEQVKRGIIELYFVRIEYQLADMFTKALLEDRFEYLVRRLGMRCLTPTELEVLANETA